MTVNVSKPAINLREKLAELDKPTGIAGEAMLRADTVPDQAELLGYRQQNVIINGAMNVWQRGTSDDTATSADYTADRFRLSFGGLDGNVDWDQETSSTPEGFGSALKISTDASETSLDAADHLIVSQRIEGQNLQHFKKGTSKALPFTVSFWVRSSVASTYTLEMFDDDNSRACGQSYRINQANTWEYKTVVFPADTTGSFGNDANHSATLSFWLDAGSNYTSGTFSTNWQASDVDERVYDTTGWLESTSPTFYITGVQLVAGNYPEGLPFMHRSYGEELALCQRYFIKYNYGEFTAIGALWSGGHYASINFPTTMRATPSGTSSGAGAMRVFGGGASTESTGVSFVGLSLNGSEINVTNTRTNQAVFMRIDSSGEYIEFNAEL